MTNDWKFETLSVHAGYSPDPTTRAVVLSSIAVLAVDYVITSLLI